MTLGVYITVDAEIWPAVDDRWPRLPLAATQDCAEEISAYIWGRCKQGVYGLPYQLDVLRRHGLKATYFIDPMFSFALGTGPLRDMIALVREHGQRVELHLHPEWLTDPRCPPLPAFRGPFLGEYDEEVQYSLICIARDRLIEAGAESPAAFRAGNWGASRATLRALARAGIAIDASLSAGYRHSFPDLPSREACQAPCIFEGVLEIPMTRFDDGVAPCGRPLSFVGVSLAEMCHTLERLQQSGAGTAVIVMHADEFVRTDRMRRGRAIAPRRLVSHRFEALCGHLAASPELYRTAFVHEYVGHGHASEGARPLVRSGGLRTARRLIEQFASRWY